MNNNNENTEYIQLKRSDLPRVKNEILEKQNNKCMICHREFSDKIIPCVDHQHRFRKTDEVGSHTACLLIRGVLCRSCNIIDGKCFNACRRYGFSVEQIPELLMNLSKYYSSQPTTNYIHPNEAPKKPIVSKRQYNVLKKQCEKDKIKYPIYKKKQKLTKKLQTLFNRYDIDPFTKPKQEKST